MVAKHKDPGCPTISCTIGNTKIEHALLDLGASVNLLPFSVYMQLGLGDLKPTTVTLQLADRSIKTPKGMDQIPIILGRPFLATSNALINCRNGLMKLSFGNTSVDFNVFRLGFQECLDALGDDEGYDFFSKTFAIQDVEPMGPLATSLPKPSIEEAPQLDLKPLPSSLRYAFLGDNSEMDLDDEEHLDQTDISVAELVGNKPYICKDVARPLKPNENSIGRRHYRWMAQTP
ncbi:uncharacterized protein LOC143850332 [Tasmannia lanceolata]|uniref:uncharacterized protein LOC143850332 n=1 Tax=Tasmannia lanceolata TaxID=3420 RepID=UPI0040636D5A